MIVVLIGSFIGLIVVCLIGSTSIKLWLQHTKKKQAITFTLEELFYVILIAFSGAIGILGYYVLQLWRQAGL